jgi:hypothetical protein
MVRAAEARFLSLATFEEVKAAQTATEAAAWLDDKSAGRKRLAGLQG